MKPLDSICIIDDDNIYTFLLKKTISKLNAADNIVTYPNGREALDGLIAQIKNGEQLPQVILLDINMPVVDGWTFLEEFADYKESVLKHTDIYIVSSSIADEDRKRAVQYKEIKDYLVKPLASATILKLVETHTMAGGEPR
jgi:CheY-like chemotaxis protein